MQNLMKLTLQNVRKFSANSFSLNMPKKSVAMGKMAKSAPSSTSGSEAGCKSSVKLTKDGDFSIAIQVKPGAKTNAVTAPPVDGEANTAIVKYFAELLNVKKADVSLKGGKSRQKTVTINSTCGLSITSIEDILKQQVTK